MDFDGGEIDYSGSHDTDLENVYPEAPVSDFAREPLGQAAGGPGQGNGAGSGSDGTLPDFESFVAENPTLKDHLTTQLNLAVQGPAERMIGQHLVDMVDDAGYLRGDLSELAAKLGTSAEVIEDVLARLQTFEPTGVFARGLGECLALQLKERNRFDPVIATMLDNLQLLAAHNLSALRKAVGVDQDEGGFGFMRLNEVKEGTLAVGWDDG